MFVKKNNMFQNQCDHFILLIRLFQRLLSVANADSSAKLRFLQNSSSMREPAGIPWVLEHTYASRVLRTSLSSSIRRMCPRYLILLLRIASTRLNFGAVAVTLYPSFVMTLRHLLLKPFTVFLTASVKSQDSQAWVKVEQTAVLYIFSFMESGRRQSSHSLYRPLKALWAITIRCLTSAMLSPSHWVLLPR